MIDCLNRDTWKLVCYNLTNFFQNELVLKMSLFISDNVINTQRLFQPEATLLLRAFTRNQLLLTVLIWTQRYLYRAAKKSGKIVAGLLSPPSASLLTVLHPCQGWLGLWQSTISAGSCNSDSGNSAPQWLPLHQTSTTLSNASPSLSCSQESNQFQHQVEVLLEASSTFPGTSLFSILNSLSVEINFTWYSLWFFLWGKTFK